MTTDLLVTKKKGLTPVKTFGNSMYPLLHDGDIVLIKKIKFNSIRTDDIVCFKKGKKYITHRVLYKAKNYLITKGDNNLEADKKVYKDHLIGRVTRVKRNNRTFNPEDPYLYQSTIYFQEIIKIKKVFEQEKIDFVFLKGLPIHLYYEKNYPRKLYADCDILVAKNDYEKAICLLKKKGYSTCEKSLSQTHKFLKDKETQQSLYKGTNTFPIIFDIHSEGIFTITQLGSLDALYPHTYINQLNSIFIEQKMTVKIENEYFPLLRPDNELIFLFHNLFRDNYRGMHRVKLINKILTSYINEDTLQNMIEKIKLYKLENIVYPSILILSEYFQSPFVKTLLQSITPTPSAQGYIKKFTLTKNIFHNDDRITSGVTRFKHQFFLSQSHFIRKLTVFLQIKVIYSILWVVVYKMGLNKKTILVLKKYLTT